MINLKSEILFYIKNLPITNTLFTSYFVIFFVILILCFRKFKIYPSKFQNFLEIIYEVIYKFWFDITHIKNQKIFSFCLTFLFYIGLANLIILFPPFDSIFLIKNEEHIHIFRSVFSDLNMTLALGIISVLVTNFLGLFNLGLNFIKKFLSPIGILELISEFAKIISFGFRLFGNIFAGKVLLIIISSLVILIIPSFFISLEIFVGVVQAFIFFILTSVFIKVAIEQH
ncbi:MAG: ATP synthase subunit a [Candidatus Parcubacteria bacterium]|nr:MAG: ATP synthase subunit a [Candidatus Parcubacteria bacterium]